MDMNTKKLSRLALLTAVALGVYVLESQIPPVVPVPGIKLGLANAVTLLTLLMYGVPGALLVSLGRIILGGVFAGGVAVLLYSLSGGMCAFIAMSLLYRRLGVRFAFITGALGGIVHNIAQLAVAAAVVKTPELWAYLPALALAGVITGVFTGLCAGLAAQRIRGFFL
jgi:heptaprenyl diphosphate synthase